MASAGGGSPPTPAPIAPAQPVAVRVAVLAGPSGVGKTTFCGLLASTSWVRVSQDDLGGERARVEARMDAVLRDGGRVVVDRCNPTVAQRAHWVRIAARHGAAAVAVCLEGVPPEECLARIRARNGHPTLSGATPQLEAIVRRQHREYARPHVREGFARVLACGGTHGGGMGAERMVEYLAGTECTVTASEAAAAEEAQRGGAGARGDAMGRGRRPGRGRGGAEGRTGRGRSMRPGDWTCVDCHAHNFSSRASCFKCRSAPQGSPLDTGILPEGKGAPPPPSS